MVFTYLWMEFFDNTSQWIDMSLCYNYEDDVWSTDVLSDPITRWCCPFSFSITA
jgi:hypothetical protein